MSDAEATDLLEFDLRWQAAAGVDAGYVSLHPTSLVGQRNRLRSSARPRRLFEDTRVVAKETGALKSPARVLDSTPIYDAAATGRRERRLSLHSHNSNDPVRMAVGRPSSITTSSQIQ